MNAVNGLAPVARPSHLAEPAPQLRRTGILLRADPSRVIAKLFLPGQEGTTPGVSRAAAIVSRCLAMDHQQAEVELEEILAGYSSRHLAFTDLLEEHFQAVAHRVEDSARLSARRRLLIGAYFTQEFSLEAAALFNPSVVAHPDQDAGPGQLRFVMSARAVGEGHLSSVVFRTGTLGEGSWDVADVTMDAPSPGVTAGRHHSSAIDREQIRHQGAAGGADPESLAFVLAGLPERFSRQALDEALEHLQDQQLTRIHADSTSTSLRVAAAGSYQVDFPAETDLSQRVLLPWAPMESHGIEDARFVRFTEDDGSTSYLATYTAFDGSHIVSRQLQTDDFRSFRATAFTGTAATNKGMALFPRRIAGQYVALSRWDRENNAITTSPNGHAWNDAKLLQAPEHPWELIQLGNCGSPIETSAGWLVLTHGVGAMRGYSMGAILLDLDDPSQIIGRLSGPLLRPEPDERDGYVPNVVYSCGALVHERTLLLPYGCSDATIRIALLDLPALLGRLFDPTAHT